MFKSITVGVAAATMFVLTSVSAFAQDDFDQRFAVAQAIVAQNNSQEMYRLGLEASAPVLRASFQNTLPTATPEQLDEGTSVILEILYATYSEIQAANARLYAERFTLEELQDIQAFGLTSTGRKFNQEFPVMMQEMGAAGEQIGQQAIQRDIASFNAVFE
jgi:hypothetical protein